MSTKGLVSQDEVNFSRAPLHFSHPRGNLNLLLLPPLYLLGGAGSLLSPPPLLPPPFPPPFLSSPLLLLLPHSAATWHCALPSTQIKCGRFGTLPIVLPPNRPTPPPPAPAPSSKSSSPLSSPPSPPPGFPVPSLSLPPHGPEVPHPLTVGLPAGINTGEMTELMVYPSISTCSEHFQLQSIILLLV